MKKKLLTGVFALAAFVFSQDVFAQSDISAPVTVNINLTDAISITLGADPTVDFNYADAADYTEVQTVTKTGHFSVISNQEYSLTVEAEQAFAPTGPALDIVTVTLDPASVTTNGGTANDNVPLSTTAANLLTGGDATTGSSFNVLYEIPDASSLLGLDAGTYSTTVVYTATQL